MLQVCLGSFQGQFKLLWLRRPAHASVRVHMCMCVCTTGIYTRWVHRVHVCMYVTCVWVVCVYVICVCCYLFRIIDKALAPQPLRGH